MSVKTETFTNIFFNMSIIVKEQTIILKSFCSLKSEVNSHSHFVNTASAFCGLKSSVFQFLFVLVRVKMMFSCERIKTRLDYF